MAIMNDQELNVASMGGGGFAMGQGNTGIWFIVLLILIALVIWSVNSSSRESKHDILTAQGAAYTTMQHDQTMAAIKLQSEQAMQDKIYALQEALSTARIENSIGGLNCQLSAIREEIKENCGRGHGHHGYPQGYPGNTVVNLGVNDTNTNTNTNGKHL